MQSQHLSALNGAQKTIIDSAINFYLNDIIQTFIAEPEMAIKALIAITYGVAENDKADFASVLDSIEAIHSIINHQFPQNVSEAYPYVGKNKEGFVAFRMEGYLVKKILADQSIQLKNGRIISHENCIFIAYHKETGRQQEIEYIIAQEPQGKLTLTMREDSHTPPITRDTVVAYIALRVIEKIAQINALKELQPFIAANKAGIKELLQLCDNLTIDQFPSLGETGLKKLLGQPIPMGRLLDKVQIPVEKFVALDDEIRAECLKHAVSLIKLKEASIAWHEILELPQSLRELFYQHAEKISKLIEKKKTTFAELRQHEEDFSVFLESSMTTATPMPAVPQPLSNSVSHTTNQPAPQSQQLGNTSARGLCEGYTESWISQNVLYLGITPESAALLQGQDNSHNNNMSSSSASLVPVNNPPPYDTLYSPSSQSSLLPRLEAYLHCNDNPTHTSSSSTSPLRLEPVYRGTTSYSPTLLHNPSSQLRQPRQISMTGTWWVNNKYVSQLEDGNVIVSAGGTMIIVNPTNGEFIESISQQGHTLPILTSLKNNRVAATSDLAGSSIYIFDLNTGNICLTIPNTSDLSELYNIDNLLIAFSKGGGYRIHIYDITTGHSVNVIQAATVHDGLLCVGKNIVVVGSDLRDSCSTLLVINPVAGEKLSEDKLPVFHSFISMTLLPDATIAISDGRSGRKTITIYDSHAIDKFRGFNVVNMQSIQRLAVSDSGHLLVGDCVGNIHEYDYITGTCLQAFKIVPNPNIASSIALKTLFKRATMLEATPSSTPPRQGNNF